MTITRENYKIRVERLRRAIFKAWEEGDSERYYLANQALGKLHLKWDIQKLTNITRKVPKSD